MSTVADLQAVLRSDFSAGLQDIRDYQAAVAGLKNSSATVAISADSTAAMRAVQDVTGAVEGLQHESAAVPIAADGSAAMTEIQHVQGAVEALQHESAGVPITADADPALKAIEQVKAAMAGVEQAKATARVGIDISNSQAQLAQLQAQLAGMARTPHVMQMRADVSQAQAQLNELRGTVIQTEQAVEGSGGAFKMLQGLMDQTGLSGGRLGSIFGSVLNLGAGMRNVMGGLGGEMGELATGAEGAAAGMGGLVTGIGAVVGVALAAKAVITSLSDAISGFVSTGLAMNASLETTELQFATLMHSADEAHTHVMDLFDFAAHTPFETQPVIEASRMLRVFGQDALDTKDNLTLVGNASAAVSAPIQELSFWFGRMYSAIQGGQPFGEAAMRLQELAVLTPEVRQEMERLQKSGASAGEVWAVFADDMGKFDGAMEKQAHTMQGLKSSLSDLISLTAASFTEPLFKDQEAVLSSFLDLMQSPGVQGGLKSMADGFAAVNDRVVAMASGLRDAIGPEIVQILGELVTSLGDLATAAGTSYTMVEPLLALILKFVGLNLKLSFEIVVIGMEAVEKAAHAIELMTLYASGGVHAVEAFIGAIAHGKNPLDAAAAAFQATVDTSAQVTPTYSAAHNAALDYAEGLSGKLVPAIISTNDYEAQMLQRTQMASVQMEANRDAAEHAAAEHLHLGKTILGMVDTARQEAAALQSAAEAAYNLTLGARAAWMEQDRLSQGMSAAKGQVSFWSSNLSDAQGALKILQDQIDAGTPLNDTQAAQYDTLTWAVGRYQGGIEDSNGAVVDAATKQAAFIKTQDDLKAAYDAAIASGTDATVAQEQYNQGMAQAVTAMDPVAGAQLGIEQGFEKAGEAMKGVVDDLVKLLDAMGLIPHSVAIDILGDSSAAQQAADDAKQHADDLTSHSPYHVGFTADTTPAETGIDNLTQLGIDYNNSNPNTDVDANVQPASGHLTDLGLAMLQYEQSNPNTDVSANTEPGSTALALLVGAANAYAILNPTTTASANTSDALSAINGLSSAIAGVQKSFTVYAEFDYTAVTGGLAAMEGYLPNSPAEKGPMSTLPDWSFLTWTVPAAFDAGVAATADGGKRMMQSLASSLDAGADVVRKRLGDRGLDHGHRYGHMVRSGAEEELAANPTIGDLLLARVEAGLPPVADAAGLEGQQIVDALVKGVTAGLPEYQNIFELMRGDALTALAETQRDLEGQIRLAGVAGEDTEELQKKLDAVNQIIQTWAEQTGLDFQEEVTSLLAPDVSDDVTSAWLDLLGNIDDIVSGDFQKGLQDKLTQIQHELLVAEATGAPQAVIDALTQQQAEIEAQLTEAGLAYQAAIDAGLTDPAAWAKTQEELKQQIADTEDYYSSLIDGSAISDAKAEMDRLNAELTAARATGASNDVIQDLNRQLVEAQAAYNKAAGDTSILIAKGLASPEAIAAYNEAMGIVTQIPIDQLLAIAPQMEDGGLQLIKQLVAGVAGGTADYEDVMSLIAEMTAAAGDDLDSTVGATTDQIIASLQELRQSLLTDLATALAEGSDPSAIEANLAVVNQALADTQAQVVETKNVLDGLGVLGAPSSGFGSIGGSGGSGSGESAWDKAVKAANALAGSADSIVASLVGFRTNISLLSQATELATDAIYGAGKGLQHTHVDELLQVQQMLQQQGAVQSVALLSQMSAAIREQLGVLGLTGPQAIGQTILAGMGLTPTVLQNLGFTPEAIAELQTSIGRDNHSVLGSLENINKALKVIQTDFLKQLHEDLSGGFDLLSKGLDRIARLLGGGGGNGGSGGGNDGRHGRLGADTSHFPAHAHGPGGALHTADSLAALLSDGQPHAGVAPTPVHVDVQVSNTLDSYEIAAKVEQRMTVFTKGL